MRGTSSLAAASRAACDFGLKVADLVASEISSGDGSSGFLLELTCLKEHPQAYELGENESHLCFRVAGDYDAIRRYHKEKRLGMLRECRYGTIFHQRP